MNNIFHTLTRRSSDDCVNLITVDDQLTRSDSKCNMSKRRHALRKIPSTLSRRAWIFSTRTALNRSVIQGLRFAQSLQVHGRGLAAGSVHPSLPHMHACHAVLTTPAAVHVLCKHFGHNAATFSEPLPHQDTPAHFRRAQRITCKTTTFVLNTRIDNKPFLSAACIDQRW